MCDFRLLTRFQILSLILPLALVLANSRALGQERQYFNSCDPSLTWDEFYTKGTGGHGTYLVFPTGGNPFGYLQTQMSFPSGGAGLGVFLWSPFVYTPSAEGPIAQIDLGQSRATKNVSGWASTSLQYVFILRQAGKTYMFYTSAPATPNAWQTQVFNGFTANNFWEQDETSGVPSWNSHPDFSSNGGPIQFGYHLGAASASYDYVQCLDNYFINIHTGDPNIVFNGGFERDLAGWRVVKEGESGVYVTGDVSGSKVCYIGKGFENVLQSGDSATIEQDLPPVRTDDVTGFRWRHRSFGATTEQPWCILQFTDGSAQSFGGGYGDGTWQIASYQDALPSGKVLKKISMRASGGLTRVVGFVDDITITAIGNGSRSNILTNSGFELANPSSQDGHADFISWEEGATGGSGGPSARQYSSSGLMDGPRNRNTSSNESFVVGGSAATSYIRQRNIPIQKSPTQIDGGNATYIFSGWLGGRKWEMDYARATLLFKSEGGAEIAAISLGDSGPEERHGLSKMILLQKSGTVPPGARSMEMLVEFTRVDGATSDGCVDDLGVSIVDSASRIEGQLSIPGYRGTLANLPIIGGFIQPVTGEHAGTFRMLLEPDGKFSIDSPLEPGIYDLTIRSEGSLTREIRGVGLSRDVAGPFELNLILGDVDGDNYVGTDDYLILNESFGLNSADVDFDPRADLDGDWEVSTGDYLLLNEAFDLHGE